MKKFGIICAGLVVALASQAARAQAPVVDTNPAGAATDGVSIWYDIRNTAAAITAPPANSIHRRGLSIQQGAKVLLQPQVNAGNNGGPGDGEVLYLSPRLPANPANPGFGLHWTPGAVKGTFVDQSVKSIFKYATVRQRSAPDEVVAALGLDTTLTKGGAAATGNYIESLTVTTTAGLWNGNNSVVVPGPAAGPNLEYHDPFVITAKAVKVPVSDNLGTPTYNATGGLIPAAAPYLLGSINVKAGVWKKSVTFGNNPFAGTSNGTYAVKDKVNNLLVTRVYSAGGPSPEEIDFGYITKLTAGAHGAPGAVYTTGSSGVDGNLPEVNSGGDGLTIGTTSVQQDAMIVIQTKGDFDNSGTITSGDNVPYNAAIAASAAGTIRIRELYLGDFNASNTVTAGDNVPYVSMIANTAATSCPTPASCP